MSNSGDWRLFFAGIFGPLELQAYYRMALVTEPATEWTGSTREGYDFTYATHRLSHQELENAAQVARAAAHRAQQDSAALSQSARDHGFTDPMERYTRQAVNFESVRQNVEISAQPQSLRVAIQHQSARVRSTHFCCCSKLLLLAREGALQRPQQY